MPLHCSHLFQFLNIGVFVPLKHTLNKKIDVINQYNLNYISRIFWIKMYIKICIKNFFIENLKTKWKKIELIPLNSNKIFNKLFNCKKLISN